LPGPSMLGVASDEPRRPHRNRAKQPSLFRVSHRTAVAHVRGRPPRGPSASRHVRRVPGPLRRPGTGSWASGDCGTRRRGRRAARRTTRRATAQATASAASQRVRGPPQASAAHAASGWTLHRAHRQGGRPQRGQGAFASGAAGGRRRGPPSWPTVVDGAAVDGSRRSV
jgi:hypothetical protein